MSGRVISRADDIFSMSIYALATTLVQQWIDSPLHEENMRAPQYTFSGVGIFYDAEQEYLFATHNLCFRR